MNLVRPWNQAIAVGLFAILLGATGCTEANSAYSPDNEGGNNGADSGSDGTSEDTGGDDTSTNPDTAIMSDTGSPQDTGVVDDTSVPVDTGPPEDTQAPTCDLDGFTLASSTPDIVEEADFWQFLASNEAGGQFIQLGLDKASNSADVGDVTFGNSSPNRLIMGDGCDSNSCQSLFVAISGTLEIQSFDKTLSGIFEGTLRDVRLIEIEVDANGVASVVENGKVWCIDGSDIIAKSKPADNGGGSCDNEGFNPGGGRVVFVDGDALYAEARSSREEPTDILSMQIFSDFNGAATSPGTYQLDDPDYETCANCLLVNTDCSRGQGGCNKTFIAEAGTLTITSTGGVGDTFEGKIDNAELIEVDIDFNNDFETTPVEGGETWCITNFKWNEQIRRQR